MTIENTPVTPTNDASVAPAPEAPVATPTAEPALPNEPTTSPVAQEVKTTEQEAPKPKEASLLDAEPEAPKPETEITPDVDKKDEGTQSDEPAPLPSYEPFTLPEGLTLEQEKLTEFTNKLAEFELNTKADHAEVQKLGQNLVDLYLTEVTQTTERINKYYSDAWEKQTNDWKESFLKDPEIGGARQETTLAAAREFIRTHGGTPEQQAEFRQLMTDTGVGNHPAMIRLFANAKLAYSEGKPLNATTPITQTLSKVEKRYGKTS